MLHKTCNPMLTDQSFRVLALDGGGIRGAYAAAVLAAFENSLGKSVVDHFDLITGTSTGGIIAIALALGVSAKRVLDFYTTRGPEIFCSKRWHRAARVMRALRRPRYPNSSLKAALTEVLGEQMFGASKCRLAIPAYDVTSNNVHVFKTAHQERFRSDYKRRAVEVALATTAAPTYFPMTTTTAGEQLIDGGVWANCPAMVGIAEALEAGARLDSIKVLSVGTLGEARTFSKMARGGGLFQYRDIVSLLMDAQTRSALAQARLLLRERLFRIDQMVQPGLFALDDARGLADLIALGQRDGRHHAERVMVEFLSEPVRRFQPNHVLPTPNCYRPADALT